MKSGSFRPFRVILANIESSISDIPIDFSQIIPEFIMPRVWSSPSTGVSSRSSRRYFRGFRNK
jgi:hypothetical protein